MADRGKSVFRISFSIFRLSSHESSGNPLSVSGLALITNNRELFRKRACEHGEAGHEGLSKRPTRKADGRQQR